MSTSMAFFAFVTSLLAVALCYAASPHQRWFREPLPALAARGSACLSALVAIKAWIDALSPLAGAIAWLTTSMFTALICAYSAALIARRTAA